MFVFGNTVIYLYIYIYVCVGGKTVQMFKIVNVSLVGDSDHSL